MKIKQILIAALLVGLVFSQGSASVAQNNNPLERDIPIVAEVYRVGANAYVRGLTIDRNRNSLWVGTSVGVLEVDLKKGEPKNTFTRKQGLANEYVFAIGVDPKGPVWMGTNAGGASTYTNGKWKTYFPMHGLADYWVYSFAFEDSGNLWIGTWDGASYFDKASGKFTNYRKELINVWVYGIDIDKQNRVWFGTEGGVSMFDKGKWSSWTDKDGLGVPNVKELARSPNTGLGTRRRHNLTVAIEAGQDTYNANYVFAVKVDNRDTGVWFGTWGGGVSQFKPDGSWQSYSKRDGMAGNIVYSIAQEKNGTLWFGTDQGASRFDGKNWTNYNKSNGLISNHIYAMAIDDNNMVWLGSRGGVTRLTYSKKKGMTP